MQGTLTVKSKEYLTPHYIRIILNGEDLSNFEKAQVGDNNKIAIPDKGMSIATTSGKPEGIVRTYTLRALDMESQEMAIDFVAHGEEGPASEWAINAQTGDELRVFMKQKNKQLFKSADWTCLVGDHTALPVISVILEQLPEDAKGLAILEVYSEEGILELERPAGIDIKWIFNQKPGEVLMLPTVFEEVAIPETRSRFIFSAAEYQSVKQIQEIIRSKPFIRREEWQSFSYWKYGQTESESGKKRRTLTNR